jgi:hypothetical protein
MKIAFVFGWVTLYGFSLHILFGCLGGHRTAMFERGLVFEEIITVYEPQRRMEQDIHTDPAKIPPTVPGEHVMVGTVIFG